MKKGNRIFAIICFVILILAYCRYFYGILLPGDDLGDIVLQLLVGQWLDCGIVYLGIPMILSIVFFFRVNKVTLVLSIINMVLNILGIIPIIVIVFFNAITLNTMNYMWSYVAGFLVSIALLVYNIIVQVKNKKSKA